MAKVARKAAATKAPKTTSPTIKPVKQTLTKSALINLIAEENEIPRKTAAGVYATLENLFLGSVHPRGVGEFVLPAFSRSACARSRRGIVKANEYRPFSGSKLAGRCDNS